MTKWFEFKVGCRRSDFRQLRCMMPQMMRVKISSKRAQQILKMAQAIIACEADRMEVKEFDAHWYGMEHGGNSSYNNEGNSNYVEIVEERDEHYPEGEGEAYSNYDKLTVGTTLIVSKRLGGPGSIWVGYRAVFSRAFGTQKAEAHGLGLLLADDETRNDDGGRELRELARSGDPAEGDEPARGREQKAKD